MFTKDAVVIYLFIYKGCCLYFLFCLQRTAVFVFCYSFAKNHGPCVVVFILKGPLSFSLLFICKGPLSLYLLFICKGCCPCLVLFICKGPSSLSKATHLQRTTILVLCYSFAKDCRPCLMLFICKGLRYLFCAISLQRKLLFLLSICCPGKIRWTTTLAKHGETASLSGFVKMAVTQISTWDCRLSDKHLIVKYEELLFTHKHTGLLSQKITKDCGPCLVSLVCKENCCPCFPLVFPGKLKWTAAVAKHGDLFHPRACENGCFTN